MNCEGVSRVNKTMVQECLVGLSSFIALFFLCLSSLPQVTQMCQWQRARCLQRRSRWRWLVSNACGKSWCAESQSCASCECLCFFWDQRFAFFWGFFFFNRDTVDTLNTTQRHACYFLHTYIKLGAQYLGKLSICPLIIPRAGHACSSWMSHHWWTHWPLSLKDYRSLLKKKF